MKGFDPNALIAQARKMKEQMARQQEKLKERIVEGNAGGGVVQVFANCAHQIVGVKIKPEAVDPSDPGFLEDLVMVAANDALRRAGEIADAEMSKLTGGLM